MAEGLLTFKSSRTELYFERRSNEWQHIKQTNNKTEHCEQRDRQNKHIHKRYIHNQMVCSHSWRVCLFVRSSNSAYWHFMHPCVICTYGWICIGSDCVSIYMLWFFHTKLNAFAHVWTFWTYRIYCKYEFKQPGDMCIYCARMWRKTDFCSASFPNKILFLSGPVNEVRTLDKSIYGRFNGVWSFEPCYLRFDASLSSFSTYIK